jgi:nucleoside-diphosphate-sugar epimerase
MKVFITGGSGFIGLRLTEKLILEKNEVKLLTRNPLSVNFKGEQNISIVKGDLSDKEMLASVMQGCEIVFHLAAYVKPWSKDPEIASDVNIKGTENVLEAAMESGVRRVVITSTAGIMGFSSDGKPVDESTYTDLKYYTQYERTKREAEKIAVQFSKKGLEVVIVNPTRVYGPGKLTKSNSVTRLIRLYMNGFWRFVPGDGKSIGNYVFIDDVVEGHLLAALKGKSGERYILGGSNLSFTELFSTIAISTGKKRKLFNLPYGFLKGLIAILTFFSGITGIPPILTNDWFDKYMKNSVLSSDKAIKELGYRITPPEAGVSKTVEWLKSKADGKRQ